MIIQDVPFYWDTLDGTHCYEAVLKMILKHFNPSKDYSWDDLRKMTGKQEGIYTWPQRGYISLKALGFEIKIIDTFHYDKFIKDGVGYLKDEYGEDVANDQEKNSNIEYEIDNISKSKKFIVKEDRKPNIEDIKNILSDGYLVECGVNPYKIRGMDEYATHSGLINEYAMHSVLIIGFNDDSLIIHDPGFSSGSSFEINNDIFNQAWAYPKDKMKAVAAFKLSR